jgi:tetratricopeptide (TPR) repeat protein
METFTTVSLNAVRDYLLAQELANANEYQKAIDLYHSALKHDPEFGRAYSGLAVTAYRAGKTQEAENAYRQAFARLDRMTEREKLRTLGAYHLQLTGNAKQAMDTYGELIAKYPADRAGYSNLAIAHFNAGDFSRAMQVGRLATDAYPRDATFRSNLALFAMYASDFKTAAAEGQAATKLNPQFAKAYLSIAISAIDAGDLERGRTTYERMKTAALPGPSLSLNGLADLAMYSGRPGDAIELLRRGLAEDEAAKRDALVVAKQAALAEALEAAGDRQDARKLAVALAARSKSEAARVSAALLLLRLGGEREAERIATELAAELQPQRQAYGRIIEAELARGRGQHARAAALFLDARKSADLWLGRLLLGRTYLEAAKEAEALSELEAALKRRGEATALFLDDYPTFRYVAPLHYWLGRANQAMNARVSAQQHYEAFLRLRPETSKDPLAADARKRLGVK